MTRHGAGVGDVLVRFPTHPHSVRTARQLVCRLRRWMREEVSDQIRHARPPRSWDDWLATTGQP